MAQRNCPACTSSNVDKLGDLSLTFIAIFTRDTFAIVRCKNCDTIFQSPLPTQQDFKTMYEDNNQFSSDEYREPNKVQAALEYYGSCYQNMCNLMGQTEGIRILEVGAGLAWMCRAGKQHGPNPFTVAQDVTNECATECAWVDEYLVGSIDDARIERHAPYDIASLTHVIEHLPDPIETLRKLRQVLRPRGCIFITAPHRPEEWTGSSPAVTWSSWRYNHVPAHLQYFSRAGIEAAAEAAEMKLASWMLHENGQAFEVILRRH